MILHISWKNIWRNKVRSLVVIAAITVGLFGGVFGSAIMKGVSDRRMKSAIQNEISHIQIHQKKFMENMEIQFSMNHAQKMINEIGQLNNVQFAASRLKISAMVNSPAAGSGVVALGVDPQREQMLSNLDELIWGEEEIESFKTLENPNDIQRFLKDSCGNYLQGDRKNQIVIGEKLAEKLKVKVRSKIVLTMQTMDGNLTGASFRVAGIFRCENSMFEEMNVFVKKSDLVRISGSNPDEAHEIAILLKDADEIDETITQLEQMYPDYEISGWKDLAVDLAMINEFMDAMLVVFMVIILIALGFGIVNTMLMVVLERVKELGMLMAVGMNKARLFSMIMLESVMLSLVGGFLGMLISGVLIHYFGNHGIDVSSFAQGLEAIGFGSFLYPAIGWEFYLEVTLLVIITGIISSVYPALKALKLNPSDALRTE